MRSPASDQHGLGMVAYTLLTGMRPIPGSVAYLRDLPNPRVFVPELPIGITPALQRATHHDPGARFASCTAFADALQRSLDAKPARLPVAVSTGLATAIGRTKAKKSPVNQDASFLAAELPVATGQRRVLAMVADGVSTSDIGSGDIASNCTAAEFAQIWRADAAKVLRDAPPGALDAMTMQRFLHTTLVKANARVVGVLCAPPYESELGPGARTMATTAVAAMIEDDWLQVANVGDSRCYLFRGGVLEQVSIDQDVKTQMLRAGRDLETVQNSSATGALIMNLGRWMLDATGAFVAAPIEPDVRGITLADGDVVVLCSDGVPDCLRRGDEEIAALLARGGSAQELADRLVKAADDAGGEDNITAIVLEAHLLS